MQNEGLGTWMRRRREKSRSQIAIRSDRGDRTYVQLAERVERLARGLRRRGVVQGTRVAYLGENHPAFLETLFATTLLGGIFVPLNVRLAPQELAFALENSASEVLVYACALKESAISSGDRSGVHTRIAVEDGSADEIGALIEPAELFETVVAEAPDGAEAPTAPVTLDEPAVILYTSGTTGRPKGAVLTHGNLTWNALSVLVDYDYTSRDVSLQISPLFHVASLGMGALPVLLKGATLILHKRFSAPEVLRTIETEEVTALSGVPTTYQMLAEHPSWNSTDLSSLKLLTCGGSAVPLRVMQAYESRGLSFSGGYGMTETSPGVTCVPKARSLEKVGSSGLPHFFTEIRVTHPSGRECSRGQVGEIHVKGPNVTPRYWNRFEATAGAFTEDGWFRSGDLGRLDEDGFLYITGRLKDMIISGGENIYPMEVEQAILELPEVESAAVIGIEDDNWGEIPKAFVVLTPDSECSIEYIQDHLAGRLAKYKIPKLYAEIEEMPLTASGKIRKHDLKG